MTLRPRRCTCDWIMTFFCVCNVNTAVSNSYWMKFRNQTMSGPVILTDYIEFFEKAYEFHWFIKWKKRSKRLKMNYHSSVIALRSDYTNYFCVFRLHHSHRYVVITYQNFNLNRMCTATQQFLATFFFSYRSICAIRCVVNQFYIFEWAFCFVPKRENVAWKIGGL